MDKKANKKKEYCMNCRITQAQTLLLRSIVLQTMNWTMVFHCRIDMLDVCTNECIYALRSVLKCEKAFCRDTLGEWGRHSQNKL